MPIPGVDIARARLPVRAAARTQTGGGAAPGIAPGFGPRLRRSALLLALVFVAGVAGFMLVERLDLLEAVYTTTIILSTVGLALGEQPPFAAGGQILTILLIWGGVGIVAYLLTQVVGFVISGEFNEVVRAKRMEKVIGSLRGHIVVCGTDKAGEQAIQELSAAHTPVVLVCQDEAALAEVTARFGNILTVRGVATEAEVLERANVRAAQALLCCLPTDAENLFLVLTARELAPSLLIVAQASTPAAVGKLGKVGADHVVAPEIIAGTRMASVALRPTALAFLDVLTQSGEESLRLEEVTIPEGSRWAGSTLAEVRIPQRTKLLVIGMRRASTRSGQQHGPDDAARTGKGGTFVFNPSASEKLSAGDTLVVLGTPEQRGQLESVLAEKGAAAAPGGQR